MIIFKERKKSSIKYMFLKKTNIDYKTKLIIFNKSSVLIISF